MRTQTLRAKQAVAALVGKRPHDDGLEDAALSNIVGELGNLRVRKVRSRVGRIFLEAVDRARAAGAFGGERGERELYSGARGLEINVSSTEPEPELLSGPSLASSTRASCSSYDLFQAMRMARSVVQPHAVEKRPIARLECLAAEP